jgi:transcriptional/translational regulatory protein YebC/TACO1
MLAAAEGGADDVSGDGSSFEVTSTSEALREVRQAIEGAGFQIESAELTMLPKTTVEITEESAARTLVKLVEALEELDDVQEVYANFDIPEQLLEAVAS